MPGYTNLRLSALELKVLGLRQDCPLDFHITTKDSQVLGEEKKVLESIIQENNKEFEASLNCYQIPVFFKGISKIYPGLLKKDICNEEISIPYKEESHPKPQTHIEKKELENPIVIYENLVNEDSLEATAAH